MSDIPADINLRDILARIDLQQAETRKFTAEALKLTRGRGGLYEGVRMSDIPTDSRLTDMLIRQRNVDFLSTGHDGIACKAADVLDLPDILARIDRQQEETRKFVAEQHKLMAEAKKFGRDPWFLVIGAIVAGVFTRLPEILRALGFGG
jgi:hypothetical protein